MPNDSDERTEGRPSGHGRIAEIGPVWISAIGTLIAALVAAAGLLIANSGGVSGSSSEEKRHTRALPPASAAPKVGLCKEQLEFAADGTAGPLTCLDGDLNVLAWEHYARIDRLVMSLGPEATPVQVGQAMCSDLTLETTVPEEEQAFAIANIYNNWNFAVAPTEFFPDNC